MYDSRLFAAGGLGSISGTVGTLPAGAVLGEERWHGNVKYRLVCNAGNSQVSPGYGVKRVGAGAGPYSVTVTTTTESVAGIVGACQHATIATGYYGWVATLGHPVKLVASNISLATNALVGPAADGKFITTDTVYNQVGVNIGDAASGSTALTDATGNRFRVNFEKYL